MADTFTLGQKISTLVERAVSDGVAARLDVKGRQLEAIVQLLVQAGLMGPLGDPCIEVSKLLNGRVRRTQQAEEITRLKDALRIARRELQEANRKRTVVDAPPDAGEE